MNEDIPPITSSGIEDLAPAVPGKYCSRKKNQIISTKQTNKQTTNYNNQKVLYLIQSFRGNNNNENKLREIRRVRTRTTEQLKQQQQQKTLK